MNHREGGAPSGFSHVEHGWIPVGDDIRLSARLWLPRSANEQPVPAILEYIPYRKRAEYADRSVPRNSSDFWMETHIPACLSFRPASALRQQLRSPVMRLLARLEEEPKPRALWYVSFHQSP